MQSEEEQWMCPSFNAYSSNGIAEIAAKVSDEVNGEAKFTEESLYSIPENDEDDNEEEDDGFEFLTEEIFYDGQVRPVFPIFNRELLNDDKKWTGDVEEINAIRNPLRKLFIEEREDREPPSSEEDEGVELDSVPPGTYCVWKEKTVDQSPSWCKKSKSTGSGSKRPWKLRDLLRRSNSDGKDSYVFLSPKKKEEKSERIKSKGKAIAAGEKSSPSPSPSSSPIHALFGRNRTSTKGNETPKRATSRGNETPTRSTTKGNETPKRKTYLPYRQDLVGLFAKVNSVGRAFPPF